VSPLEVRVRAIAGGGAGVADLPDGRAVFVHGTAPGDRALVRVSEEKPRWARAELVRLLEEGPGRRTPPCRFAGRCGGCTLEHLRYAEQLRWKGRFVADALERIGGVAPADPPEVTPSPREVRYRSRVSFHLRRLRGGRVVAGFHALGRPGRIVDVDGGCLLPEEPLAAAWDALRDAWGPGAALLPAGPRLRLTLRRVSEGVLLVVEGGASAGDGRRAGAEELVARAEGIVAVWHRPRRSEPAELLAGLAATHETWLGRRYAVGASAFLQVNRDAAEALHAAVLGQVGRPAGLRVVDAYAGVGALGRRLATDGARVVAIEVDREAARAALDGAPDGFRVLEGTVEELLPEALPADVVVLNPPRSGVHEDVAARLGASGVERIVYVSCDPATLARDVARLGDAYEVRRVGAFDLFPQTAHVETVATLERRSGPPRGSAAEEPHEGGPCATT